tara:strand:+ start:36246 stop:36404 length:159 start_codon:yes stop_codon:yes gene_type:complete
MIRFLTAGAFALLLAGCTADAKTDGKGGNTPNANEVKVATDASSKFELGKPI